MVKSGDPAQAPAIWPNFLDAVEDQQAIVGGVRVARALSAAPALAPYVAEEMSIGADAASDADILAKARELGATIFHPSGTCKMGSDPMAVVDERLRVHGIEGLRVIDASIMPTLVSGNTNAPTIMIAEKASDMIRVDARAMAVA